MVWFVHPWHGLSVHGMICPSMAWFVRPWHGLAVHGMVCPVTSRAAGRRCTGTASAPARLSRAETAAQRARVQLFGPLWPRVCAWIACACRYRSCSATTCSFRYRLRRAAAAAGPRRADPSRGRPRRRLWAPLWRACPDDAQDTERPSRSTGHGEAIPPHRTRRGHSAAAAEAAAVLYRTACVIYAAACACLTTQHPVWFTTGSEIRSYTPQRGRPSADAAAVMMIDITSSPRLSVKI